MKKSLNLPIFIFLLISYSTSFIFIYLLIIIYYKMPLLVIYNIEKCNTLITL